MDRLRALEFFVEIVEAGSFVAAAETMRTSKASLSRHLQSLETHLGARLLNRTTRRLSLTEAGRVYYERCKLILEELEEIDGIVGLSSQQANGRLRINAPLSFGIKHLAPLWGRFMAEHPAVELDITLADRMVDLVDEGYDMAIRITRMPDSSLVARRLTSTRLLLCASPEYLAKHGVPQTLPELAQHQTIGYSYAPQGDVWHFEGPEGPASVTTHPRLRANNGDTCRAVALNHQGISLQPDFLVSEDINQGTLIPILPEYTGTEIGVYAVYPSRKHLSGKVRAMLDFLVKAFAEDPDCLSK